MLDMQTIQIISAYSTVVIAAFTVIYAVTTILMFISINNQYKEMKTMRRLDTQPFIAINSMDLILTVPYAARRNWESGQIEINSKVLFDVQIENISNSPALMVKGIGKLRLYDRNRNKTYYSMDISRNDYLSSGQKQTLKFHFLQDKKEVIKHMIELERLEKGILADISVSCPGGSKELDNMWPRLELYIQYENLSEGKFLLGADINYKRSEEGLSPQLLKYLEMIDNMENENANLIKQYNAAVVQEQKDKLFEKVEENINKKVAGENNIKMGTVILSSKLSMINKKVDEIFNKERTSHMIKYLGDEDSDYLNLDTVKNDNLFLY